MSEKGNTPGVAEKAEQERDHAPKIALFGFGCVARHLIRSFDGEKAVFSKFSSRMNLFGRAKLEERKVHLLNRVTGGALAKASALFSAALGEASRKLSDQAAEAEYALVTVPPVNGADLILQMYGDIITHKMKNLKWLGYLSTIGVYGDLQGGVCDENTPVNPKNARSRARVAAERQWLSLYQNHNVPVHIFRLAGIYAEDRNNIRNVISGDARSVVRQGHAFNRIHAEDIAGVLRASMRNPTPGEIFNVADDEPANARDINNYIALLTDSAPPPELDYENSQHILSERMNEFYQESKRADNGKIKRVLGYRLKYPNYRAGYAALTPAPPPPPGAQIN